VVHHPTRPEVARVVNAVVAYAERTSATILAEGIETEAHLASALAMGARVGQGWLFGRGRRLRRLPAPPREPLAFVPAPQTAAPSGRADARTPFQIVSARRPTNRSTREMLLPISRYLEAKATDRTEPPVLLASFQDSRHVTPAAARRYAGIAGTAALVATLAPDLDHKHIPGVRTVALPADDPLRAEWNVIVVGPHFAGALVARDLDGSDPDGSRSARTFEYALSYDRGLVLDAARSLLHRITRTG